LSAGLSVSGTAVATGSSSVAVVPFPAALDSCSAPPSCTASPCTIDSPSPVPFPSGFEEKNGSIARFNISGVMPLPVSITDSFR
jgi:hypothetical protein